MNIPPLSAASRTETSPPPASMPDGDRGFTQILAGHQQAAPRQVNAQSPASRPRDTQSEKPQDAAAIDTVEGTADAAGQATEPDLGAAHDDQDDGTEGLPALALDIALQAAMLQQGMRAGREAAPTNTAGVDATATAGTHTVPVQSSLHAAATPSGARPEEALLAAPAATSFSSAATLATNESGLRAAALPAHAIGTAAQLPGNHPGTRLTSVQGRLIQTDGAFRAVRAMQARLNDTAPDTSRPTFANPQQALAAFTASQTGDALLSAATIEAADAAAGHASQLQGLLPPGLNLTAAGLPQPASALLYGASGQVAAPLQSAQWPMEFGRQFVALAQGADTQPHTAELRLDPPELGPLRIILNVSDSVAHASFVSAHASVRNAVEQALPQLQQLLSQAGLSLGQANVSDHGQAGQGFEQAAQQAKANRQASEVKADTTTSADTHVRPTRQPATDKLVDTFA
ncbi:flagellar hook-length control protein FliK [Paracandidimonas lactea]|uniref:flagellar hook-length control protein FliK n=1 Tax=Paracandidimonas lactea TaxID=2895524 RepID=UPI001F2BFA3E|nr:flagellar hook-length control protein FliK [Paracandidimonas lactea]